ncbi:ABC transporter ATP-binding protein [Nocardioides sp. ChNu-99]|uniref:ABC transporter ATP-binding protein n=1 Tax=Nocardioides sp. ChNu-99 TaxID=2839897 RepID=UPI002406D06F|nr:ABC transporter ATP-binding protein [Nocardioides sp. ChNu-99]MDF9716251.1 ABC transporter ATP-binding protein [Nocardioides sp. ChNu-99]
MSPHPGTGPRTGLELVGVGVEYDGAPALRDASLHLPRGEVLAVLGPSGSGKSTLLRAVAGLEDLASGSVAFDGEDLAGVPVHRRSFALMFQDGQLFAHLSVGRNVAYPLRLRRTPRPAVRARVAELLELVGLAGYADRPPATLSGGERQRVALARALACEPRLLLLDEPLSALDRGLRERLAGDLRRILVAAGTTALLVTHDVDEALATADRLALVRGGRVVQEGPAAAVDAAPVDADAARQLGYAHVLAPDVAARALAPAGAGASGRGGLAVRRTGWEVVVPGGLAGTVTEQRRTGAGPRLVVAVPGVGEVEARLPGTGPAPAAGAPVRVAVDPASTAPIG